MATFEDIKRTQASASETVPAGVIQAFAGSTAPDGWHLCDGTVLLQADHPKLFANIGSVWDTFTHPVDGTPVVNPGEFALPNLSGLYLASQGNGGGDARALGVFQAQKTAPNGLQNAASSVSGTTNISHAHSSDGSHTHESMSGSSNTGVGTLKVNTIDNFGITYPAGTYQTQSLDFNNSATSQYNSHIRANASTHSHSLGTSNISLASGTATAQSITGDTETRPATAPVTYIIKL